MSPKFSFKTSNLYPQLRDQNECAKSLWQKNSPKHFKANTSQLPDGIFSHQSRFSHSASYICAHIFPPRPTMTWCARRRKAIRNILCDFWPNAKVVGFSMAWQRQLAFGWTRRSGGWWGLESVGKVGDGRELHGVVCWEGWGGSEMEWRWFVFVLLGHVGYKIVWSTENRIAWRRWWWRCQRLTG